MFTFRKHIRSIVSIFILLVVFSACRNKKQIDNEAKIITKDSIKKNIDQDGKTGQKDLNYDYLDKSEDTGSKDSSKKKIKRVRQVGEDSDVRYERDR